MSSYDALAASYDGLMADGVYRRRADYLEKLMTTYPSVPAEDWKKYLCIVQKAVFSEEEISQEEARFCYRLYRNCLLYTSDAADD